MTAEADLDRVRGLVGAALASLETSRGRIDDLNVYPVPDGDTGTNLTLTVRAVADAVSSAQPADRPALARAVARAALMGARGNSGVILSQIVRGVGEPAHDLQVAVQRHGVLTSSTCTSTLRTGRPVSRSTS